MLWRACFEGNTLKAKEVLLKSYAEVNWENPDGLGPQSQRRGKTQTGFYIFHLIC